MSQELPSIQLVLDKRSTKFNKSDSSEPLYPVKLYVYNPSTATAKRYGTKFSFTEQEFKSIWLTEKPRRQNLLIREDLSRLVSKAEDDLKDIEQFTFQAFEAKLFIKSIERNNVFWYFDERIKHFKDLQSIGTSTWYTNSKKSLQGYLKHLREKNIDILGFDKIDPKWLQHYELYMLQAGKSKTTISMYLRALRAVFVAAKKSDDPIYPFGKDKYKIKKSGKVKKALTNDELKTLFNSNPLTPEQHKAKDFWFFSFCSNGMNIKDILYLRFGAIGKKSFSFERIKTKNTDSDPIQIIVFLNEFTRMVIKEYGNKPNGNPKQLVFPFINESESAEKQHLTTKGFTRFINQHIKKLAQANGITAEISSYYARHTFATGAIRNGESIAFVQEALGHSNPKTTQNYMAGFLDEEREKAADALYTNLSS